ncbi:hypothetical protein niasHT_019915 [Heterodera trifolii]|uniref:Uncharacterized protein n=1 Tax=Heterodera trifolii TaxID=157864 RepID=A0ABD2L8W1_9BILA
MAFTKTFAVFIFLLLQPSIRSQQQQQQNVIEQSSPSATAAEPTLPLSELHNTLNQFLYQLKQTGEKVVAQTPQIASPLLFNAAAAAAAAMGQQQQRHSAGDGGAATAGGGGTPSAVRPFVPIGHVPIFPSSLLVPTAAHLPPTFRLPATVMEQHKAFPMEGSPSNPPVVVLSPMNNNQLQHSKRHKIGSAEATGDSTTNGTTTDIVSTTIVAAPPLSFSETPQQNTVSNGSPATVSELENTVHDDGHATIAATDVNANTKQQQQQVVAAAVVPPLAVPIEIETTNDTTPNVTVPVPFASPAQTPPLSVETTTVTEPTVVDDYGSQRQRIFFVPGGVKSIESNGSRQALTAVDLEAFLRSANVARILSTWNNGSSTSSTTSNNANNSNNTTMTSSQDTKLFLALVERVLEQEVARRLAEQQPNNNDNRDSNNKNSEYGDNSTQRMSPPQHNHAAAVNTAVQQVFSTAAEDEARQQLVQAVVQHRQQQQQSDNNNNDDLERDLEERLLDSQKLLKTANTRLFSLASNEAEAVALVPAAGGHRDRAVPAKQQQQHHQQQQLLAATAHQQQKGVINLRRGVSTSTIGQNGGAAGATVEAAVNKQRRVVHETDYKQREQAEFDRLLDRLKAEESIADGAELGAKSGGAKVAPPDDTDLLLIVPPRPPYPSDPAAVTNKWQQQQQQQQHAPSPPPLTTTAQHQLAMTTSAPVTLAPTPPATSPAVGTAQQQQQTGTNDAGKSSSSGGDGDGHAGGMMLNRQHQFWSRHGPKTKFERLVEDYRWRLMGQDSQNGLNDLIKALRNSNIGFFDRHSSPSALKILRRVD